MNALINPEIRKQIEEIVPGLSEGMPLDSALQVILNKLKQKDKIISIFETAINFYSLGWVERPARKNEYGRIETVWKNTAVQTDGGTQAKSAIYDVQEIRELNA